MIHVINKMRLQTSRRIAYLAWIAFSIMVIYCVKLKYQIRDYGIQSEDQVMHLMGADDIDDEAHKPTWIKVDNHEYVTYNKLSYFEKLCVATDGTVVHFSHISVKSHVEDGHNIYSNTHRIYEDPVHLCKKKYHTIINKGIAYYFSFSIQGKSRNSQYLYFFPDPDGDSGWLIFQLF